ncbi:glycosyltransferase 61 family protein [Nocardioides sp. cx-173]|uniref:glycosyltransferase 61 family protein n=1 Tax=Nocardioides sp. cx-173 TaxID=2898796 RepID=UPI001E5F39B4|nr:glycosyltransferase 61 family protein [Nocardioides sp. cx-173]MCD4525333.1 glycosyltransferase 61 family protein [Nocardioides sp. cx-173]UGB40870.1 glycosyltransferase 61 family protein [Nocardioides sp. cx-173]
MATPPTVAIGQVLNGLRLPSGAQVAVADRIGSDEREDIVTAFGAVVLDIWRSPGELAVDLAARGPFDAVVDLTPAGNAVERLRVALAHLRPGGHAVLRVPVTGPARADLLALVEQVRSLAASGRVAPPTFGRERGRADEERDLHALAAGTALRVKGRFLVATQSADVRAPVPERRLDELLTKAPERGRTLHTVPAVTWEARGRFASSLPGDDRRHSYAAPQLALRELHAVLCLPHQIAVQGHVVLPASFRNVVRPRPRSRWLVEWSRHSVLAPEAASDPTPLAGPHYYADNVNRGHFGHAVTEQLSMLWGWDHALAEHPDLRLLVTSPSGAPLAEWELELLEAAGVDRARVTVATGPTLGETLMTGTPGYAIGSYVHPELRRLYDRVVTSLADRAPAGPRPRRLFLTRAHDTRACHNAEEVEELFRAHGFEVTRPEQHSLPKQLALVRAADVVAGFAGSGLFPVGLLREPATVIVVGSDTYPMLNERQLCAFAGHDLRLVRCRADIHTEHYSLESFHSPFTFDPQREGRFLAHVLDGLTA